jgi:hypothetical protein
MSTERSTLRVKHRRPDSDGTTALRQWDVRGAWLGRWGAAAKRRWCPRVTLFIGIDMRSVVCVYMVVQWSVGHFVVVVVSTSNMFFVNRGTLRCRSFIDAMYFGCRW